MGISVYSTPPGLKPEAVPGWSSFVAAMAPNSDLHSDLIKMVHNRDEHRILETRVWEHSILPMTAGMARPSMDFPGEMLPKFSSYMLNQLIMFLLSPTQGGMPQARKSVLSTSLFHA